MSEPGAIKQSRKHFLGAACGVLLAPLAFKTVRAAGAAVPGRAACERTVNTVLQNYVTGFGARNAEMLASPEIYSSDASGDNLYVLFDVLPSLVKNLPYEDIGTADLLAKNKAYFAATQGPTIITFTEVHIDGGSEFIFYHGMMNAGFTYKDGRNFTSKLRHTMVFKNISGKYLMVHEHISVPATSMGIETPHKA